MTHRSWLWLLLVGCAEERTPCERAPEWHVPTTFTLHAALIRSALDGSIVVFDGGQLIRISRDGAIGAMAPVGTEASAEPSGLEVDDLGGPVLLFPAESSEMKARLRGFDAAFSQKWMRTSYDYIGEFATGPAGDTAFWAGPIGLHCVEGSGMDRWAVPETDSPMRLTRTGELFLFDVGERGNGPSVPSTTKRRHLSSSGVVISEREIPFPYYDLGDQVLERDGGVVFVDGPYRSDITRIGSSGDVVWKQPIQTSAESLFVIPNGDILAITSERTRVARLAGATGEITASHDTCGDPTSQELIVAGDDTG